MSAATRYLLGVVLCGGLSKRMGRHKADLVLPDGQSFLESAVSRLAPLCDDVVLSTSEAASTRLKTDRTVLVDPPNAKGPIGGIAIALRHALEQGYVGCLFNPVDTPLLETSHLQRLIDEFGRRRSLGEEGLVCGRVDPGCDRLEPLIAVYPVTVLSSVAAAISREAFGLQNLLRSCNAVPVDLPASACLNINTPSDLDQLQREP